jgi:co-chaperonin GroES (HSP10)
MKELIVIGDRVLLKPDETEEKTSVGLYLPQTVRDRDEVLRGHIIKTGPGIPLADPSSLGEEPWSAANNQSLRYLPMEVRSGDYALFLRKAAVEIQYEGEKYFIVPQSAILVSIRDREEPPADLAPDSPDLSFE